MTKGVITYYKNRFVDRVACLANRLHLFKTHIVWPIVENDSDKEVGGFYGITGWKPVVRFFEWLTEDRGKNCQKVNLKW